MRRILSYAVVAIATLSDAARAFEAGVAVTDVTPPVGLVTWGYGSEAPKTTGVLDPLYARALVLRAGDDTLAIVTLDLGRPPLPDRVAAIRKRAAKAGVDYVLITASHTHQAPPMDVDEPYTRTIADQIGDTIEAAAAKLAPARIGVGRTTIDIAHNRRKILANGQCMMVWRNAEMVPLGPLDQEAGLIKIESESGGLMAVLVNYACHPVVLSWDNTQYSADWVGEMARVVKQETGAECMFLQGGCGDINPYLDKTPLAEGGLESMHTVGRTAGYRVVHALHSFDAQAPATPSIRVTESRVEVGTRWDLTDPKNQKTLRGIVGDAMYNKYLTKLKPDLSVPVQTILLNDNLALAAMPGEMFAQFQLDLKTHSPVNDTFLVGYANEFHVYFPTIKDSVFRGYGAVMNTYVGLGAGHKLITQSLLDIGRLMGRLSPDPTPEDFVILEEGPPDPTAVP
ncbi:MAG: neutral/alkaline non-lysosomal ceramidase N-terminal domain-containing protein [Candidatus Hydrogenedentota bacterium]